MLHETGNFQKNSNPYYFNKERSDGVSCSMDVLVRNGHAYKTNITIEQELPVKGTGKQRQGINGKLN
jgi:hypothetical protein